MKQSNLDKILERRKQAKALANALDNDQFVAIFKRYENMAANLAHEYGLEYSDLDTYKFSTNLSTSSYSNDIYLTFKADSLDYDKFLEFAERADHEKAYKYLSFKEVIDKTIVHVHVELEARLPEQAILDLKALGFIQTHTDTYTSEYTSLHCQI
jgi:hypothetical protein